MVGAGAESENSIRKSTNGFNGLYSGFLRIVILYKYFKNDLFLGRKKLSVSQVY